MKNFIAIFTFIAITFGFSAHLTAQSLALRGGFNLAELHRSGADFMFSESDVSPGLHIGLFMEQPISNVFSFEIGAMYSQKGMQRTSKYEIELPDVLIYESTKYRLNTNYIDIPVLLKAALNLENGNKVFWAAGPYISFGIGNINAKVKTVYSEDGVILEDGSKWEDFDGEELTWGNDPEKDFLRRTDFGVSFGTGLDFGKTQFGVYYDLGTSNSSPEKDFDYKLKNGVYRFALTYKIFGK